MSKKYIISFDEGTTSARAVVYSHDAEIVAVGQREFRQIYPNPGWVEHNPEEIFKAQIISFKEAIKRAGISLKEIKAIGITNQRETSIIWDKNTGIPLHNAIVWQCRRTSEIVDNLIRDGYGDLITEKTGLIADSYFSATKIKWLLDNIAGAREKAENGELLFGTIDTYLLWRLSGGKIHKTDYTNASRTMLFNIHRLEWDPELLEIMNIPDTLLPEVCPSSAIYGYTDENIVGAEIPLSGVIGDQQGALFGQTCFESGDLKNTYGTGCFLLLNTGKNIVKSENKLLTTIAFGLDDKKVSYALEGSVFMAGAVVQWLRDGLGIIKRASETEALAKSVEHTDIYLVPAFVGLGAPYWDQYARGIIIGITRGTTKAHLVRAALESVAFQTRDVLEAMESDCKFKIKYLNVDGGMARNDFLMQFQSDILDIEVIRPRILETTALGAAYLAGLAVDYWEGLEEIKSLYTPEAVFRPNEVDRDKLYKRWKSAVKRASEWASN